MKKRISTTPISAPVSASPFFGIAPRANNHADQLPRGLIIPSLALQVPDDQPPRRRKGSLRSLSQHQAFSASINLKPETKHKQSNPIPNPLLNTNLTKTISTRKDTPKMSAMTPLFTAQERRNIHRGKKLDDRKNGYREGRGARTLQRAGDGEKKDD